MRKFFFVLAGLFPFLLHGQGLFPVNGIHDQYQPVYAFTNATVFKDYKTRIDSATLIIYKGKIEYLGKTSLADIPDKALVYDLQGKFVYPSFIDLYANYGMPPVEKTKPRNRRMPPQFISDKRGPFNWNEAVKPEYRSVEYFKPDQKQAFSMLQMGYGMVVSHQQDGIVRGSGTTVLLNKGKANNQILDEETAAFYSLSKGSSSQNYPSSLMGALALIRQTFYDAVWYQKAKKVNDIQTDLSIEKMIGLMKLPMIFEAKDKLDDLRIAEIGREFGKHIIVKGKGDEYQRINEIKSVDIELIIPLVFPEAFDVRDPLEAEKLSLSQLKHWEMAPANAAMLNNGKIVFSFTSQGLKNEKAFLKSLSTVYQYGLPDTAILKALTLAPARQIGLENHIGTLDPGKYANFIITSTLLLDKDCEILENWSKGVQNKLKDYYPVDLRGEYQITFDDKTIGFKLDGKYVSPSINLLDGDTIYNQITWERENNKVAIAVNEKRNDSLFIYRFSGIISDTGWAGKLTLPDGEYRNWIAVKTGEIEIKPQLPKQDKNTGPVIYPFTAYGNDTLPKQETYLIKNTTVWTNEEQGIVVNQDVLFENGVIVAMGDSLTDTNAILIDGTGKHLTCGIVDEHSHTAIKSGVNEGTQAITAEVRIGDVINSEDINIYRKLAGGVTTLHLLHGSANPIGGQTALIKLRWGMAPEKLKFKNTASFIKFALGENVKQSNWGDNQTIRYPQTRMGVEQIMYDAFFRALDYLKERDAYSKLGKKEKILAIPPRVDLELEALSEILEHERFITCHSYRQSEINMIIKLADSMGFRLNTFTHILEGYKVADKMKEHGAGASTFSDWWAYKYEVIHAIPYNAALLSKMGIVTAINSDDNEMGRRLNQEAAKAIRYGGVSEEEAWKMVTLYPAKLLQIDHKVGSVRVGKDADLVLWSDNPLSIYAKAEKTFVDGVLYFDLEKEKAKQAAIKAEKNRLIQLMLKKNKYLIPKKKPVENKEQEYHCNDVEEYTKNYGHE